MAKSDDRPGYSVLCVDDEEHSLKYFRKICRRSFDVLTAETGAEALSLIAERGDDIGVVMTDQRMPGMKGVEVLKSVRESHPGIVRILTTAYSDLDSAIAAVNDGAIHKYVVKPWDVRDLEALLKWALDFFILQKERNALLRERMDVLRHFLVADRVQSLATLAAGLAHHIRNSTVALKTFLDMFPSAIDAAVKEDEEKLDLASHFWELAAADGKRIVEITNRVAEATVQPSYEFSHSRPIGDILARSVEMTRDLAVKRSMDIEVIGPDGGRTHRIDDDMPQRLFAGLFRHVCLHSPEGAIVTVTAESDVPVRGTTGSRVGIRGMGMDWTKEDVASLFTAFAPSSRDPSELGLDLLTAFFICYHHGGQLKVNREAPDGPGFSVLLPYDPEAVERLPLEADYLEGLLMKYSHNEAGSVLR